MNKFWFVITGLILVFVWACSSDDDMMDPDPDPAPVLEKVNLDLNAIPYSNLSDYNFYFGEMADMVGNEGVVPYDLVTPLFTDYAIKDRFIWMPEGTSASYAGDGAVIEFPVGSVIIKNFKYNNVSPSNSTRILETRLLIKTQEKWEVFVYEWNEEQTDASFLQIGRTISISWTQNGNSIQTNYKIPTQEECKNCHRYDGDVAPIGPKPQNLSKMYNYSDGSMNQLQKWTELGYLSGAPSSVTAIADWENQAETLEDRARAYLDVNCAHCHNEKGTASNTSLFYNIEIEDTDLLGYCKQPISAGGGATGGHKYDIVPGNAEESILVFRLSSTEAEIAMPELGRTLNHTEGIQLISDWIDSLEPDDRCN